jgi:hypothetical protein
MQPPLFPEVTTSPRTNGVANKLDAAARAVHDRYRFVLSFT